MGKQVLSASAERERCCAIMEAAMKSNQVAAGLAFMRGGESAKSFEGLCASLRGEPGTFGHKMGIGPDRTADDINAQYARTGTTARTGNTAREMAAAITAAGEKAGRGGKA